MSFWHLNALHFSKCLFHYIAQIHYTCMHISVTFNNTMYSITMSYVLITDQHSIKCYWENVPHWHKNTVLQVAVQWQQLHIFSCDFILLNCLVTWFCCSDVLMRGDNIDVTHMPSHVNDNTLNLHKQWSINVPGLCSSVMQMERPEHQLNWSDLSWHVTVVWFCSMTQHCGVVVC